MADRPVGLYWEEYEEGEVVKSASRTITEADIVNFSALTWDHNPLHTNEEFAKSTPHGGRIAHGALTFAYSVGLMNMLRRGEGTVIAYAGINVKYTAPVRPGDTIRCVCTGSGKKETKKPDRGLIFQHIDVINQSGVTVVEEDCTLMVRRKPVE